jgi:two-component system OmpR family response regulator
MSKAEIDVLKVFVKSALRPNARPLFQISFGPVRINFSRQEWFKDNVAIQANAREFRLIQYFFEHEGEVISREQLLREVWKFTTTPNTRSVDNYILTLRKKIEPNPAKPQHLFTLRNAGYKFVR